MSALFLPDHTERAQFEELLLGVVMEADRSAAIVEEMRRRLVAHPEPWARRLARHARFKIAVRSTLYKLRTIGKVRCIDRKRWEPVSAQT